MAEHWSRALTRRSLMHALLKVGPILPEAWSLGSPEVVAFCRAMREVDGDRGDLPAPSIA
jgi:hypothetical protein